MVMPSGCVMMSCSWRIGAGEDAVTMPHIAIDVKQGPKSATESYFFQNRCQGMGQMFDVLKLLYGINEAVFEIIRDSGRVYR